MSKYALPRKKKPRMYSDANRSAAQMQTSIAQCRHSCAGKAAWALQDTVEAAMCFQAHEAIR